MKEITEKLRQQVIDELHPLAERLAKEGHDSQEIAIILQKQLEMKMQQFYQKENRTPKQIGDVLNSVLEKEKADSKAEKIFYKMLVESNITFKFQYSIGPYRADYLFEGFLVLELDGPQHKEAHDKKRDAYMRRMGYKIIRVPIWVLTSCPEAVIEEIKESVMS